jgi:hypothetical protein
MCFPLLQLWNQILSHSYEQVTIEVLFLVWWDMFWKLVLYVPGIYVDLIFELKGIKLVNDETETKV